jgi:hypothetical protein
MLAWIVDATVVAEAMPAPVRSVNNPAKTRTMSLARFSMIDSPVYE